jgi:hypothetical protein
LALLLRNVLSLDAEETGGGAAVDVGPALEEVEQDRLVQDLGDDPYLDLRVIDVDEDPEPEAAVVTI